MARYCGPSIWLDIEIDGVFHAETANDDARRAVGLGLRRLSFSRSQTLDRTFVDKVFDDAHRALQSHGEWRRRSR